jgi:predicted nucleotidyltransferase
MQFIDTLDTLNLPAKVRETIHGLLKQKLQTSELGRGPKIPILEDFIQEQIECARRYCESAPVGHIEIDVLNKLFRQTINESWRS